MSVTKVTGESGQMAVELAVLMPVVIVVALAAYNLVRYVNLCAVFDRIAPDVVVSQGTSPSRSQGDVAAVTEVERCLSEAMRKHGPCAIEVCAERVGDGSSGMPLRWGHSFTRFTCTMRFHPWPASFVLAGVPYESPVVLVHARSLVVDRYGSGVVM